MRTIDRSTRFKRDYKRESKGRHRATLDADLLPVLAALATATPLDPKYRDHDLSGHWAGYRDCHVKHDLVLIYATADRKIDGKGKDGSRFVDRGGARILRKKTNTISK